MYLILTRFFRNKYYLGLSFLTASFLALSFPPIPIGILAFVGFVPLLILIDRIDSFWRFFRYSYLTFFFLSIFTLYWVAGFTHLKDPYLIFAGIALFLWQPLFFTIPASLYYFIRKTVSNYYSIYSFPFIWIGMEWLYALGEFAFPWLTIGNTQTYQLEKIQFIDLTGVYGISFWVLFINILIFKFLSLNTNTTIGRKYLFAAMIVGIYLAPNFYHWFFINPEFQKNDQPGINVGIVQPNVDPWDKWDGANTFQGRWKQVESYLSMISVNLNDSIDIVVLPESAILINLPAYPEKMSQFRNVVDSLNVSVISGFAKFKYYESGNAPVSSNKVQGSSLRWDSFNSIFFIEPKIPFIQTYSKMRLVPFAERIPYADNVPFLIEPLRWGVGISNWGHGVDSTIFKSNRLNTKFLAIICYESIFPEFIGSFVRNGAEFLVFITNDSWWGNTSGARQHQQYAVLRAIENRRWVVRCANGGISSFIDPMGNSYDKTEMYVQTYIKRKIYPIKEKTFYSENGDWFARICASIGMLFILLSIGYKLFRK